MIYGKKSSIEQQQRMQEETDIRKWESDSEARIAEAVSLGFVEQAAVRRKGDTDGEVGEIIGYTNDNRAKVIKVKFPNDEFSYRSDELELVN